VPAANSQTVPLELPGLHNVFQVRPGLWSGSSPEGDAGFASLKTLGIKTIISVDGAKPEVETARRHGLRYVHLPIGYDGVPHEQGLRLARAVRDLPGPVYIHCHHGKHRGPAAATAICRCLDEGCGVEQARQFLQRAGTDPRYVGLQATPELFRFVPASELDRVPADFPEVAEVPALAEAMVKIDEHWDRLNRFRSNHWQLLPGEPDLTPAHEALQLAEAFQESARLPPRPGHSPALGEGLDQSARLARELEAALRMMPRDSEKADALQRQLAAGCRDCHSRFRDVPQARPDAGKPAPGVVR
jgi:protein tyrosine phosphatase (PTP) superfamily phosphohydrolase (DUF442 family)